MKAFDFTLWYLQMIGRHASFTGQMAEGSFI